MKVNGYFDIHCHILPGIDDGPKDFAGSIGLAKALAALGFRHVIATPHYISGTAWTAGGQKIADLVRQLNIEVKQRGINLNIYPGMEIALDPFVVDKIRKREVIPLAESGFYLIEPPFDDNIAPVISILKKDFETLRSKIVLAHVERIPGFQKYKESLTDLFQNGFKFQVNIGSLLGLFGQKSFNTAKFLMEKNMIHFLATDSHGIKGRSVPPDTFVETLTEIMGADQVNDLLIKNPQKILNESMRHQHG